MLNRLLPLFISVAISTAAFANDAHHPDASQSAKAPQAKMAAKKGPMSDDVATQFSASQEQMKKMQGLMDSIHQTKDPKEHQRLMQEHMQTMLAGMQAMRSSGGGMMGNMMNCSMMGGTGTSQNCPAMGAQAGGMSMGKRAGMMQDRLDMMQMMMEQMIQHENEQLPTK